MRWRLRVHVVYRREQIGHVLFRARPVSVRLRRARRLRRNGYRRTGFVRELFREEVEIVRVHGYLRKQVVISNTSLDCVTG